MSVFVSYIEDKTVFYYSGVRKDVNIAKKHESFQLTYD